ncbi:MAG TPA: hypothetical protein VNU26_11350 [Mycobacteriales bacterium]|nr:hypothetical protein [Mycobacteriales bacterium]
MSDLAVLQAVRLKGRADAAAVARCTGTTEEQAATQIAVLVDAGLLKGGPSARITPEGRSRLEELTGEERQTLDAAALERIYEAFHGPNDTLKSIMTSWQMKDAETPNDHSDEEYDSAVVQRVLALDEQFRPVLAQAIDAVPRLAPYQARFDHAVEQLRTGDTSYVARPIMDSYHTVWFELHEELIGLLGRDRTAEALAGRAV